MYSLQLHGVCISMSLIYFQILFLALSGSYHAKMRLHVKLALILEDIFVAVLLDTMERTALMKTSALPTLAKMMACV